MKSNCKQNPSEIRDCKSPYSPDADEATLLPFSYKMYIVVNDKRCRDGIKATFRIWDTREWSIIILRCDQLGDVDDTR